MNSRRIAPALLALTMLASSGCYHMHRDYHRFRRDERRWEDRHDRNDYRGRDGRRRWWYDRGD